jgi:hypothetical protein
MNWWNRIVRVFRSRYVLALEERIIVLQENERWLKDGYEEKITSIESEKSKLLDRILLLTTGAPLDIPAKSPFDQPEPVATKNTDEPIGQTKTLAELLADAEAASFKQDLEDNGVPEEIVENANLTNALIDADEADGRRQAAARKNFKQAFDSARDVYLHQINPTLTSEEQKESGKAN